MGLQNLGMATSMQRTQDSICSIRKKLIPRFHLLDQEEDCSICANETGFKSSLQQGGKKEKKKK